MAFCVLKYFSILIPCEQRFLSSMTFSICKVICMACQSCSWFVYALRETSARSHLWFPLSMHFRHLHNLEESLYNTELNTTAAGIRCLFKKRYKNHLDLFHNLLNRFGICSSRCIKDGYMLISEWFSSAHIHV